jgi:hypothetical protein
MLRKPILLDTNLLVLLTVGQVSENAITTHKRLGAYTKNDYRLLLSYITGAPQIAVTPNVITEASNLLGLADDRMREKSYGVLRTLLAKAIEIYIPSKTAAEQTHYRRLGITDAALLHQSFEDHELLTVDVALYEAASRLGRQATNFTHTIEANSPD